MPKGTRRGALDPGVVLTHHVHILEMNRESFRLAASKKALRRSVNAQNAAVNGALFAQFEHP